MEFLRSLLRRPFARAQVASSRNVGCLLSLYQSTHTRPNGIYLLNHERKLSNLFNTDNEGTGVNVPIRGVSMEVEFM